MTVVAIQLALLAALAIVALRALRRARAKRRLAQLPAGSAATAMAVGSFVEIDEEIARRRCGCGGRLKSCGETSYERQGRRLRAVTVECVRCERRFRLYFDVTMLFQ